MADAAGSDDQAKRWRELRSGCTTAQALAFFDTLPAVTVEEVLGSWTGSELPTGHPFDGLLEVWGWVGKRFDGPDDAHPLLVSAPGVDEPFAITPTRLPFRLLPRVAGVARNPLVAKAGRRLLPLLRTARPQARLRMMAHRGVVTATMTYDLQPINDHFRRVDAETLLGVMDLRGMPQPYFFVLHRSPHGTSASDAPANDAPANEAPGNAEPSRCRDPDSSR